jgi:hypothetical protein
MSFAPQNAVRSRHGHHTSGTAGRPKRNGAGAERQIPQTGRSRRGPRRRQIGGGGQGWSAITAQLYDQRAAVAQEKLTQARDHYKLLRETMLTVLKVGGEPRSAARLAREAAAVARDVAKAVKDIAAAAKSVDPAGAGSRRAALEGVRKESRKLLYGIRSLVDAARIVNDFSDRGLQKSRRAKEISQARRDAEDALAGITRELGSTRMAIGSKIAIDA